MREHKVKPIAHVIITHIPLDRGIGYELKIDAIAMAMNSIALDMNGVTLPGMNAIADFGADGSDESTLPSHQGIPAVGEVDAEKVWSNWLSITLMLRDWMALMPATSSILP